MPVTSFGVVSQQWLFLKKDIILKLQSRLHQQHLYIRNEEYQTPFQDKRKRMSILRRLSSFKRMLKLELSHRTCEKKGERAL